MSTPSREAVGQRFDPALMQRTRERNRAALHGIRERMRPGISEGEAKAEAWRTRGLSGETLYAFAHERAAAMGWRFNHAIKGHRVGDFPHSIHKGGDLADLDALPSQGLWILEIQIVHPTQPFGAFYEDLLSA